MTTPNDSKGRMIFKVLVIGNDLPLQTGFLSRASGDRVSCQLYSTIGLSLGVAKFDFPDNQNVVLQMWSIPISERMEGLSRNFTKGHNAIILIIRPDEIENIPHMFERLSLSPETPLMIVVVGSVREAEAGSSLLNAFLGSQQPVQAVQTIEEITESVATGLLMKKSSIQIPPKIVALDEDVCPLYVPILPEVSTPPNTIEEINQIREIAINLGLRVIGESCAVEMDEGVAWVCMKTGTIRLAPGICRYCSHYCKRQANICIVGTDTGWSSLNIGSRALLTIAKIYALTARTLPSHVKKQIQRATVCFRFDPNPAIPIEEIPDHTLSGFKDSKSGKSLLQAARERVKEGRLSKDAYTMLKRKLQNLESSQNH
ncbi:MAG: hypothetical protein ACFFE2_08820 [Candidatus Thorarchaeota archaeon]